MSRLAMIACLILSTLCGCSPRRDTSRSSPAARDAKFGESEESHIILVDVDMSGSFERQMADDGEAFKFLLSICDRYFRDKIGTKDKIVISLISGSKGGSLIFEGTPQDLRKRFRTPADFRDFLNAKKGEPGSLVYRSIRDSLRYVLSDAGVASGRTKVGLFVLSDLIDGDDDKVQEGYMNHELSMLGKSGGVVGCYYADADQVVPWRQRLQSLGIKDFRVEGGFRGHPPLPSFE